MVKVWFIKDDQEYKQRTGTAAGILHKYPRGCFFRLVERKSLRNDLAAVSIAVSDFRVRSQRTPRVNRSEPVGPDRHWKKSNGTQYLYKYR